MTGEGLRIKETTKGDFTEKPPPGESTKKSQTEVHDVPSASTKKKYNRNVNLKWSHYDAKQTYVMPDGSPAYIEDCNTRR